MGSPERQDERQRVPLNDKVKVLRENSQGAGGEGDLQGVAVPRGDPPCTGAEREA